MIKREFETSKIFPKFRKEFLNGCPIILPGRT
jgi:hypothetical protein